MKKQFVKVDISRFNVYKPFEYILDKANILRAIEECVNEGDLEGVMEMVRIYRRAVRDAKKFGVQSKSASISHKKNPESNRSDRSPLYAKSAKVRVTKKIA
jgi:hypothetical protein